MAEPRSTMDRLHAADEQRQRNAGKVSLGPLERRIPTPAEKAEAERRSAARALPDAPFMGDQEVRSLSAVLTSRTSARDNRRGLQRWLSAEAHRLATELEEAEKGLVWSVLADAVAQDEEFSWGSRAVTDLFEKRTLAAAVTAAFDLLGNELELNQAVAYARDALRARLFELKLAHVDAQSKEQQ